MIDSVVLDAWRFRDISQLATVLTENATFSSPVADYRGRANAAHVLGLIATVLDSVEESARWRDERDAVFAFTARAAGSELHGMIREEHEAGGGLGHVTLYLRPYRALREAMAMMAERLRDSPLPESVG
ncbi:hypothetical protein [Nocardia spumae]|uniref:hypothetical protein n=1 Tax=Nocardia spumae TaxID=2887190 RepID=UPI001D158DFF|nr:hypothetical protein [Nocardia spumae]